MCVVWRYNILSKHIQLAKAKYQGTVSHSECKAWAGSSAGMNA